MSHRDRDAAARASRGWYLLLVLPFAGLLWPPFYVRDEPRLGGVPFFYWYQFAWVVLSAALTWVVVRMTEAPGDEDPDRT